MTDNTENHNYSEAQSFCDGVQAVKWLQSPQSECVVETFEDSSKASLSLSSVPVLETLGYNYSRPDIPRSP